jgi:hypothetical protein
LALPAFGFLAVQARQELIQFADLLQSVLHFAIPIQGLADLGDLLGTQADLAGFAARITDIENPEGMAFAAGALGATGGVMNGALEEGAAEDLAEVREPGGEAVSSADGPVARHR